jgi:hypothetical protein
MKSKTVAKQSFWGKRDGGMGSTNVVGKFRSMWQTWRDCHELPTITIDLMHAKSVSNDVFFRDVVRTFYRDATSRHPRLPLVRKLRHGVAICKLPACFDEYFMAIEAAARRNFKKAQRDGFEFARIDFNDHLVDVAAIHTSTDYRQGEMPKDILLGNVAPVNNPKSQTTLHDYPYFGIRRGGRLYAYASCLVAGELCMIETIYGHAEMQSEGIVPMLIISMADHVIRAFPSVKYYAYGTYFGARESMQRFKRKFLFLPHRVTWKPGEKQ